MSIPVHLVGPSAAGTALRSIDAELSATSLQPFSYTTPCPCSSRLQSIPMTISSVSLTDDLYLSSWRLPYTLRHHDKVKATDETLTGENWEIILNMCDKVQDEGEQGSVSHLATSVHRLCSLIR